MEKKVKRIPINDLKKFGVKNKLDHIIIFATQGLTQHVASWGSTLKACNESANFSNDMRKKLGWPEKLAQESASVKQKIKEARLDERLKVLREVELELNETNHQHHHYYDVDTSDDCAYNKCPNRIINELRPKNKRTQ